MANHLFIDLDEAAEPAVKVKHTKDETLLIDGHASEADTVATEKQNLDASKKALEQARASLEGLAQQERLAAEKRGDFASKVQFQGTEQRIIFAFTNAFSTLDPRMRDGLNKTLGQEVTEELFEEQERLFLRSDKTKELFDMLKTKGIDPDDFFETDKSLAFAKDFRRKRFELREKLTDKQNEVLDTVAEAAASRPSLTTK